MRYRGFNITYTTDKGVERENPATHRKDIRNGYYCEIYPGDDDQYANRIDSFCLAEGYEIHEWSDHEAEKVIRDYVDREYYSLKAANDEIISERREDLVGRLGCFIGESLYGYDFYEALSEDCCMTDKEIRDAGFLSLVPYFDKDGYAQTIAEYTRLEQTITNDGLVSVLRNGITDMGVKLRVCYFKPESELNETLNELYTANILGCTRQFQYSPNNKNTIDMVLSVNGIPVVAIELKNQFKGQDVQCAKSQYMNDRSSKEFAFRLDHRFLVYFAVDLYEAYMTTQLLDGNTRFMPFNQGSNGAGVNGGAGNPDNPNGYATAYLWEEVLERESLLDILHRFVSHVREKEEEKKNGVVKTVVKEKLLFPRFHQYDVVKKIIADVKENGTGNNYLIQHSAGSGKSNSIAWIAYRLASVHDAQNNAIFDSVIVVTNRIVLDGQLQDTINSFEHKLGLVEAIDDKKNSRSLAEALNDKKRIIICTIQKFLFAYKDMESYSGRKFAIIIDEAHQGQSGESAKTLRRSLIDIGVAIKEYAEEAGIDEEDVDLSDEYINALVGQGHHDNQYSIKPSVP